MTACPVIIGLNTMTMPSAWFPTHQSAEALHTGDALRHVGLGDPSTDLALGRDL